jgi:hypothetical protein
MQEGVIANRRLQMTAQDAIGRAPQLELPLSVAALPPVADSCDLPVHDLAIMLPLSVAALPPVADSCDLPVHDLAIMLPLSVAALPPVADACDLPVHDLAHMYSFLLQKHNRDISYLPPSVQESK